MFWGDHSRFIQTRGVVTWFKRHKKAFNNQDWFEGNSGAVEIEIGFTAKYRGVV
jgi:hypothetical protein